MFLLSISCYSQDIIVNQKWLGIEDGINFRKINVIEQDTAGLIWIGTDLGLQFYDGHQFLDYVYNGRGDKFTAVYDLERSTKGEMFLATSDGVLKYNALEGAFYAQEFEGKKSNPFIRKLIFTSDGSLFAVGRYRVFSYTDGTFQPFEPFPFSENLGRRNQFTYSELTDDEHLLLIFEQYDIIYNVRDGSVTQFINRYKIHPNSYKDARNRRHCFSKGGETLIMTNTGREVDKGSLAEKDVLIADAHKFKTTLVFDDKTLVVYKDSLDMLLYQGDDLLVNAGKLPHDDVRIEDHLYSQNGDHFLATNFGILILQFKESAFNILEKQENSSGSYSTAIRKIVQRDNGDLIYSQGANLELRTKDSVSARRNLGQEFMDIESLGPNTYFGISTGRSKIFKADDQVELVKKLNIGGLVTQKLDNTYLVGGDEGLVEYDLNQDTILRRIGARSDQVNSITLARNGNIYVGSHFGLKEYDRTFTVVRELANQSMPEFNQANINDIYIGNKGKLWLATQGNGVVILDKEFNFLRRLNKLNGLPNDVVYSVNFDGDHFWFPTDFGLAKYDENNGHISNYFEEDGISNNEFNRYAHLVTEEGEVYLGTLNGIVKIRKSHETKPEDQLKLFVSEIMVNSADGEREYTLNHSMITDKPIVVNENRGQVRIRFGISDFMSPADHAYAYRKSRDQVWTLIGNANTIDLIDLAAGNYELEIRGTSKGGQVAHLAKPIKISSLAPIYKRWWFLSLLALMAVLCFYLFYRWRFRQIAKVQLVRQNISKDLHDEVGAMLTEITILTDLAQNIDGGSMQEEYLEEISDKGREAISAMSDVIWTIDDSSCTLGDMITKMNHVMNSLLSPMDISFSMDTVGMNMEKILTLTFKKNIYLIFKESIHNIVKHSSASHVKVKIVQPNRDLNLSINNNSSERQIKTHGGWSNGQGIQTMKERAKLIGGRLDIEKSEESFRVVLILPDF